MPDVSDPNAPVLIGLGEVARRPGEEGSTEPAALMAEAVRDALEDSGAAAAALLERVGAVGAVPPAAWPDGDPGRRVAELLGLGDDVPTLRSSLQGGNGPQLLVNVLAERIQAGTLDAAIVCGAESLSTVARLARTGEAPDWPAPDPERAADEVLEGEQPASTEAEAAVGMIAPIMAYPLIENAIRAASGRTPAEHLRTIAGLWSRFSAVAAEQPAAWSPKAYTTDELATPSAANRQITFPYTKLLNSNIQVDQGAAVVLASAAVASELGVPEDRWVYVHAGARATDEWFMSERRALDRSPAIRACGEALFEHTAITAADLGPVDLYSCFPAAVQLAATELGLPLDDPGRPLTCTGGLTFFGGPGNNYATHGIVAVARQLRDAPPGAVGLSTALGWYATKHALGLYGNRPPRRAFASLDPAVDAPTPRAVVEPGEIDAVAETCTLIYDRDGAPSYGILFALADDGTRALGKTDDPAVMAAMTGERFLGARVRLYPDRSFDVL
ncbi:acetyl-CoA acetyltransferase [Baekduia sp. Peel2402]|uniref:acetyl-CoA acetyltransferase n=1 Tax=Baekduia sp. Peel2402 TaxID=3458296 RepID=UPI00403E9859